MTYSGLLMLVIVRGGRAAALRAARPGLAGAGDAGAVVALALTFTRSAWVGACVGVGLLFLLQGPPAVRRCCRSSPALFFALAPAAVTDRSTRCSTCNDPTNRDRVAMLQAGVGDRERYPLTGVGPNMVQRGLPAVPRPRRGRARRRRTCTTCRCRLPPSAGCRRSASGSGSSSRPRSACGDGSATDRPRYLAAAALGALAAMLAAGLFEYNFGDSEFLMLFLPAHAALCRRPRRRPDRRLRRDARSTLRPPAPLDRRASPRASVLVVGDVMLDQFVVGRVNRISPEAPVPVVEFDHDDYRVGGAANVAHNVARARRARSNSSASSGARQRRPAAAPPARRAAASAPSGLVADPDAAHDDEAAGRDRREPAGGAHRLRERPRGVGRRRGGAGRRRWIASRRARGRRSSCPTT